VKDFLLLFFRSRAQNIRRKASGTFPKSLAQNKRRKASGTFPKSLALPYKKKRILSELERSLVPKTAEVFALPYLLKVKSTRKKVFSSGRAKSTRARGTSGPGKFRCLRFVQSDHASLQSLCDFEDPDRGFARDCFVAYVRQQGSFSGHEVLKLLQGRI
jgi:hypothetical protein